VAIDELQRMTGSYVDVTSATESDIFNAIEQFYGIKGSAEEVFEETVKMAQSGEVGEDDTAMEAPVVRLVDQLFIKAIKDQATDIHMEPEENILRTRFRIDGILNQGPSLPKVLQLPLATRIKIMANLNISESRLPQDGGIRFFMGKKKIDLRVSTFPTVYGENVVLRVLDKSRLILGMEHLGFSPQTLSLFKDLLAKPNGIILVTGPTGSGKTTTLYSSLSYINSLEKNIITLEDPIEYELPVIRQSQINVKAGLTFPVGMKSILRQDPDIILIGEMRDSETSEIAIRAALTGHLVFSTLHTNDAAGAIPRLLEMGMDPFLVASSIVAVLAQRLVRVICENCKEEVVPSEELLSQFDLEQEGSEYTFYRGKGCSQCGDTGYKGRTGLFELLTITPEVRRCIGREVEASQIVGAARESGMSTIRQDGMEKALKGITTLEEVLRVA
jgi:type IV pilus assembly protein PilB